MTFNSKKLELLRYGYNSTLKAESSYISPDGSTIPEKSHVKDLGVMMSNTGTFSEHIKHCLSKSKRHVCLDTENIQVTLTRGHEDSMEISGTSHPGLLLPTLVSHPSWPDIAIGRNPEIVHP